MTPAKHPYFNGLLAIVPGRELELPPGTREVTIAGTYRIAPKGIYWIINRSDDRCWPSSRIEFDEGGRWAERVGFGSQGSRILVVVRTSPGVNLAFAYQRSRARYLRPIRDEHPDLNLVPDEPLIIAEPFEGFKRRQRILLRILG